MNTADTIVAIATPQGHGGIGVVRVSGHDAVSYISHLAESYVLKPFRPHLTDLVNPATAQLLDKALVTWFKAPFSFTGEDVVEFSCHGSVPVLQKLVDIICGLGARPAAPGEFTYRAVINGKMDLTQAEALNRLISADTLFQAEQAIQQLDGTVSTTVKEYEDALIDLVARMEAEVDFAEEEDFIHRDEAERVLNDLLTRTDGLIGSFDTADLVRRGATVVLTGEPNVGKSTLFNRILKMERAIVDPEPGTTRDYISERIELNGIPVTLVDTAGLRTGAGSIEQRGIDKTRKLIEDADLVVEISTKDVATSKSTSSDNLCVMNKIDSLTSNPELEKNYLPISALTGLGVDKLLEQISSRIGSKKSVGDTQLITEKRQQNLFIRMRESLEVAKALFLQQAFDEVILEELNQSLRLLGQITGRRGKEEIYERIFSSFCIGK